MGRTLLILLVGFAASFGLLANSKNRRFVDSSNRAVTQFSGYSANNASASGAYMALNRLYQNSTWRAGYSNLALGGNTLNVVVEDNSVDPSLGAFRIRIRSTGSNANVTDQTQVLIFDGSFDDFAVWAKDSVTNVSTKDSLGNFDPTLLIENAPFMPDIDYNDLVDEAASQGHVSGDFIPTNGYPNGSFYFSGATPNVTHVTGNIQVKGGRTIYGIFIIEGNATLEGNARVQGILYLPNPTSTIIHGGGNPDESSVTGGILTWGTVDGTGSHISVRYEPDYMRAFITDYAPNNPPMRVLSWQ
jgi:hypothetical protein